MLKFELAYLKAIVQHFSQYLTRTHLFKLRVFFLEWLPYYLHMARVRIDRFMPFLRAWRKCKVLSWICLFQSSLGNYNCYATNASSEREYHKNKQEWFLWHICHSFPSSGSSDNLFCHLKILHRWVSDFLQLCSVVIHVQEVVAHKNSKINNES